ncbi:MAG: VC_2705 family sodium/solute symporter [Hydrogenophilus sp.]|nr:VC_2705 family sodium/solute symporter [Hydrogenophilus sp.]
MRFIWLYGAAFALLGIVATYAEQLGAPTRAVGMAFLVTTVMLYAGIGVALRTQDVEEYYVAGRRVPGFANGMATAADWLSAASFVGLAGVIFHEGFAGLAYVVGWSGGFVLVALFLGPYLRQFGRFTIPELIGERFGSAAELLAVAAVVLVSFVYLVAQVYAVGLVVSRLAGVPFPIGLFVGLTGILVCSFLGGMRGVTWTQVAQYGVLIVAYLVPLVLLAYDRYGVVLPHAALPQLAAAEAALGDRLRYDPAEAAVRAAQAENARRYEALLASWPASVAERREELWAEWSRLLAAGTTPEILRPIERELQVLTGAPEEVRDFWRQALTAAREGAAPWRPFFQPWVGESIEERAAERRNFLALMFVLMVGTAALPHILMRYYTTSTVQEARTSTAWTLFFVALLYAAAPLYALFARVAVGEWYGAEVEATDPWLAGWTTLGLASFTDVNGDGRIQSSELQWNADALVLALPELAGLPLFVTGLVGAGAMAAALSTADGLLLTIANAVGHNLYFKRWSKERAPAHRRLLVNKMVLLGTAMVAAWVAALRLETILLLVGLAFSLAAATLFPTVVLGIFWRRATRVGALVAMGGGAAVSLGYYWMAHQEWGEMAWRLWGIEPVACGIFGVAFGFLAHACCGWLGVGWRAEEAQWVERWRRLS